MTPLLKSVLGGGLLLGVAVHGQAAGFVLGREAVRIDQQQTVVELNWEPFPAARRYRVLVATDAACTQVVAEQSCTTNTLVLRQLPQDRVFYWKVAARHGWWSTTWNDGQPGTFLTPNLADLQQLIAVPRGTPTLDGTIHPDEWKNAAAINLKFRTFGSTPLAENLSPKGALLWDETNLYVLGEMAMKNGRTPVATALTTDGEVWKDDDFELFLQPTGDRFYYHFGSNAKGARYDGRNTDGTWNGRWQVLTATDSGTLRILFVVPWAQLGGRPAAGKNWRFNLTSSAIKETISCSWAGVTVPHEPDKFGTLRLVE